jgi:hypothetical protein
LNGKELELKFLGETRKIPELECGAAVEFRFILMYRLGESLFPRFDRNVNMNGLWTAEFGSSSGVFGGGVAVLQDGAILGGDAAYFYIGTYELTNKTFKASLQVIPFIQNYPSVFKTINETLRLSLVGTVVDDQHVIAQGHPEGKPELKFGAKLTKRA